MRREPSGRFVPRARALVPALALVVVPLVVAGLAHAAVVVGADGKATRVNPITPAIQAVRKLNHRGTPPTPTPAPTTATPTITPTPSPNAPVVTGTGEGTADKEFNSCKKFPAGKRIVKLNMKPETELGDLISWISSITCRQFLLPGTIPGNSKKVTIIAPQLITPEEAYRLFLAALDSVGLTVEPDGKFLRIIETLRAKSTPIPYYGDAAGMPAGEGYITRLVHVDNGDINEINNVLTRLKGEQGDIVVYAPQNALIITDRATNVARMLKILDEIDQPGASGEKVWIVTVHNTAATDMATKLADIFQVAQVGSKKTGAAAPTPGAAAKAAKAGDLSTELTVSKIIPDERSNQLIVIATERAYQRVLLLVKKLDVPLTGGDGRIHVYYCENANCDELAQTLGAVTGVSVSGATGGRSRSTRPGATPPAPTPTPTPGGGATTGRENLLFEGEVRINFDRPTNSLIVVSSLTDYQALRRVIELLDSPRKQVFVEAMILEVTIDKDRTLGASWHAAVPKNLFGMGNASLIVGGLNPSKTLFPQSAIAETMLAGVLGPVLPADQARALGTSSTTVVDIPQFGVLVKALQTNSDVDVLSNPHLLIMNNEEGEISVGSRIPFPVSTLGLGAAAGATGAAGLGALGGLGVGGLFPQVQREKVALELKLTPHVNEHDLVRLEVDEKISEVAPGASNLGPSTSERTAKTIVVAKDQQTILIGGLMSDKTINSVTKIPILGDIPILGFFFRNTEKHIVKTNLIIAITPYVITDQSDLRRVLDKKMKERREFVERFGGDPEHTIDGEIDYRRKRGMLEEINRAAHEAQAEEDEILRIRTQEAEDESGPLELPAPPRGNVDDGATAPATGTTPAIAPPTGTPAPATSAPTGGTAPSTPPVRRVFGTPPATTPAPGTTTPPPASTPPLPPAVVP
ncbi:MAG TPA: type II secretion system secretin GspD [Polyangia bacterium]|nr:type II secretion system secretin GspD [Polyangia bacterium]